MVASALPHPDDLNARHGISGAVEFEMSPLGGIVCKLQHAGAIATVALQGGQVLDWQAAGYGAMLWLSPHAKLGTGRAVRGGIPVCWPWFGPPPDGLPATSGATWPQHGFARTALWHLSATGSTDAGAQVSLALQSGGAGSSSWPHRAEVILTVVLGEGLDLTLQTRNTGPNPFTLTQALHTYFCVGDIDSVAVERLDGHAFHDAVALGPATAISEHLRSQSGGVLFDREVDRIYIHQVGPVSIIDRQLRRHIEIIKNGSASTVVWNPWKDKADRLGDLGEDGYRQLVCVETANTIYDPVRLAPGAQASMTASYRAGAL